MKLLIVLFLAVFTLNLSAKDSKFKCKAKYSDISCSEVKGAKRQNFCWKGEINKNKMEKICTASRKVKKSKRNTKVKS